MSIYKKIALLTSAICLGLGISAALLVSSVMRAEVEGEIETQGTTLAATLSDANLYNVINEDSIAAYRAVRKAAEDINDIAYVFILDFDDKVFAHSFERGFPVDLQARVGRASRDDVFQIKEYKSSIGRIRDVSTPLIEGAMGSVHVGLKFGVFDERLRWLQIQILVVTLVIATAAAAVAFVMANRITEPLQRIVELVLAYGRGQDALPEQLESIGGGEEVAAIRDTFKEMIELRRVADMALRESEERYARAMSGTNDGLWDWNIQTDEEYFSPRCEEIVGCEPGELKPVHQTFIELLHPDDRERAVDALRAHIEERAPYNIECRLRCKGGAYVWVQSRAQATWSENGEPLRMAGSIADISERKKAEQEILELNEQLEQRVEERTAQLRDAQDTLLRKERLAAMGQLTGTVAHEIRNPLGVIAASRTLIERKCRDTDPLVGRALERMDRGIKRCAKIITELLDFARAKGLQLQSAPFDAWLLGVLEDMHLPEGITVRTDFQSKGDAYCFDPDELRRAVINVVDNACQGMTDEADGPGGTATGELTIEVCVEDTRLEIVVTDTGPGIPEDVLPQILEPLFSTRSFGTGLGLPIVQRIMQEHGGGVEITSEENKGTRVVLWFPVTDCEEIEESEHCAS